MGFFLNGQQPRAPSLRDLLAGPEPIVAPGAYDALSARLIEAAGFRAVYMTGFGTAASLLGRPDVGLLGMSEMVDNARRIVQAVAVPVIAGADVIFFERSAFASSFFRSARCSPPRAAYAKFSRQFARMARPWRRSRGCRFGEFTDFIGLPEIQETGAAVQQPAGPNEELNGKHI